MDASLPEGGMQDGAATADSAVEAGQVDGSVDVGDADASTVDLDLAGLWTMQIAGVGGAPPTTLEFGASVVGSAQKLIFYEQSGFTHCEEVDYALLADGSVQLDGVVYDARNISSDEVELVADSGTERTLVRVNGDRPIEPCETVEVDYTDRASAYLSGESKLAAEDGNLYFTSGYDSESYHEYDIAAEDSEKFDSFVRQRGSMIVAVTQDAFYYQCECGGSDRMWRFSRTTSDSLEKTLSSEEGHDLRLRGAVYDERRRELLVAARDTEADTRRNLLLVVDPDDLTVTSQREILPGFFIDDLTLGRDDELLVLIGGDLVEVGDDGKAVRTVNIESSRYAVGIAQSGPSLFVLGREESRGFIEMVQLP